MKDSRNLSKAFLEALLVDFANLMGSFRGTLEGWQIPPEPPIKLFALFFGNLLFMLIAIFHERFHLCSVESTLKVFINLSLNSGTHKSFSKVSRKIGDECSTSPYQ